MNDQDAAPPPPTVPPAPVSSGSVVLGVIALLAGLLLLIPGGLCSVMAVGMQFGNDSQSSQIGLMLGVIGLPALALGIGLLIFAIRRLRRRPAPPPE